MSSTSAGRWVAEPTAQSQPTHVWRLTDVCALAPATTNGCAGGPTVCPAEPGRVVGAFIIERRPLAPSAPDGRDVTGASADAPPGTPTGFWEAMDIACVDVTELNPPPTPAEVFNYFQRLPLPELATQHQPPGDGLSGLPVIFYTDEPTTETFTVDIRGFEVVITAEATAFTWHTGDPSTPSITTEHPGAPYPDHTITHDYSSGTYTASLTVTWGATFAVEGGAPADVPGTTTTTGPPDTFDVLQARPVLVNPR
jgi:hypothetical protein